MRISDWSSDVCSSDLVEGDHLDGADLIDGAHARAGDGTTGLDRQSRLRDVEVLALTRDDGTHLRRELCGRRGVVLRGVGDAEATTEKIGSASCRERVCEYGQVTVGADTLKKQN